MIFILICLLVQEKKNYIMTTFFKKYIVVYLSKILKIPVTDTIFLPTEVTSEQSEKKKIVFLCI